MKQRYIEKLPVLMFMILEAGGKEEGGKNRKDKGWREKRSRKRRHNRRNLPGSLP